MEYTNIYQEIQKQLFDEVQKKIDSLLIEGLSRKGYVFNSSKELTDFIISNCKCIGDQQAGIKTYYINDVAFFEHRYRLETSGLFSDTVKRITVGEYRFL